MESGIGVLGLFFDSVFCVQIYGNPSFFIKLCGYCLSKKFVIVDYNFVYWGLQYPVFPVLKLFWNICETFMYFLFLLCYSRLVLLFHVFLCGSKSLGIKVSAMATLEGLYFVYSLGPLFVSRYEVQLLFSPNIIINIRVLCLNLKLGISDCLLFDILVAKLSMTLLFPFYRTLFICLIWISCILLRSGLFLF